MLLRQKFTVSRSRRKWARRGYACADFAAGLVGGLLEHGWAATRGCARLAAAAVSSLVRHIPRGRISSSRVEKVEGAEEALAEHNAFEPLQSSSLGVGFADVAGLEGAKREIRLRMILPMEHPEEAERYRIRRGGGILLYGPPGTGKTMLAKAVASELSADFYHVAPADLITSEVGGAERNVARLFKTIRQSPRAVLFLDEIDALVPRRRNNGSTIMLRVISQILGEVDGLRSAETSNDLLLIGATNEIEMVDPAMLRPGRFDAKIFVGPPDESARRTLVQNLLEELPVSDDRSIENLVQQTAGLTGAEIKDLIQKAADEAFIRAVELGGQPCLRFDAGNGARQNPRRIAAA